MWSRPHVGKCSHTKPMWLRLPRGTSWQASGCDFVRSTGSTPEHRNGSRSVADSGLLAEVGRGPQGAYGNCPDAIVELLGGQSTIQQRPEPPLRRLPWLTPAENPPSESCFSRPDPSGFPTRAPGQWIRQVALGRFAERRRRPQPFFQTKTLLWQAFRTARQLVVMLPT